VTFGAWPALPNARSRPSRMSRSSRWP